MIWMIKKVRLFSNDNTLSEKVSEVLREKLEESGFEIVKTDYDLAIAVGGDGTFLRAVKETNFDENIVYVGVNSGTLGFLQEITVEEIDQFIDELKNGYYKLEEVGIQKTVISFKDGQSMFYSLNEIVVRDKDLKTLKIDVSIDGDLLERFIGDGLLIASSVGSTAHNLSYGGSIVFNTFSTLQITPIAPINSKVYRSLINSVIVPDRKVISLCPENTSDNGILITIDGETHVYDDVYSIETEIGDRKIKCMRLRHYNFPQYINEKLLTD